MTSLSSERDESSSSRAFDNSDDVRILEIANELSTNLGVSRHSSRIVWTDYVTVDRPWAIRRGALLLSNSLRGKLSPEEWKPLLASSLVYYNRFRMKRWTAGLFFLGASISLIAVFYWFIFAVVLPYQTHCSRCGGELVFPPIIVFFLFGAIASPFFRRTKLQADLRTVSELGGGMSLVEVLRKIDGLSVERHRSWYTRHFSWSPNIAQRIRNISVRIGDNPIS